MGVDDQPTRSAPVVFEQLSDMLAGAMRTQALFAAVTLGVPDLLSKEPMEIAEIATRVGAHEPSLYRLMRFLASEGISAELAPGHFVETPLSHGLRVDAPNSAHWLAIIRGSEFYSCWTEAVHSFVTGEPAFDRVYGRAFFDYLGQHPDRSDIFDHAMSEKTRERLGLLAGYDWSGVHRVVDLGGGNGTALAAVLRSAPHIRGVLFDLPSVLEGAEAVLEAAGVRERCDIVSGNFFNGSLPPADAFILSQILHNWNDERSGVILRNCRRAISDGGRLVLVEGTVPEGPEAGSLKLLDLHMLVLLGGKERTESEWRALLEGAGFQLVRLVPSGLLEARAA